MPGRRLLTVAAVGALAVAALTGCRLQTGADAAYVGSSRITQSDVDDVIKSIKKDGGAIRDNQEPALRTEIVSSLVFTDVAKRYAADKGYGTPTVDYNAMSQQVGLPASDAFVRLEAEANAYCELLLAKAPAVTPSDADLREVFDRAVKEQVVPANSYEQVKPQLAQISSIGAGISLRKQLSGALSGYDIKVNPKYAPLEYPLAKLQSSSGGFTAVGLPLTAGSGGTAPAVVDVSPTGVASQSDQ